MTTFLKLLGVVVNVAIIALILLWRNKDADRRSQQADQQQEPHE